MSRTFGEFKPDHMNLIRDRTRLHPPKGRSNRSAIKPSLDLLERRTLLSTAGGYSNGGLSGHYFANTTLSGTPAFSRIDDRIDFNWGSASPAGSSSIGYAGFPSSNWSAKWTGNLLTPPTQILALSNQTYTFTTKSDSGIRVIINGKTIINDWTAHTPTIDTATVSLSVGTSVSIEVDYYHTSDTQAIAQLSWSSASNPSQVIDVASPVGIGLNGLADYTADFTMADATKSAGVFHQITQQAWGPGLNLVALATTDSYGNPTQDFGFYVNEEAPEPGTYTVYGYANQQPQIITQLTPATVGAVSYNSTTHLFTTTISVQPENGSLNGGGTGQFIILFTNTGGGVTGLKVMRPTFPGSTTSLDPSILFNPAYESLTDGQFSAYRMMDLLQTNGSTQQNWSDRTLPADATFPGGLPWEDVVRLANETGKDIYINIPQEATNSYITNLAYLLKYGSDGVNPYTSPQANPVYPGLNPGIHVYIEYSNEVWNFGFTQWGMNESAAEAAVVGNTSDGQMINYDGVAGARNADGSYAGQATLNQRYHALKTLETSNVFRSVWGNAAMDTVIRPVLEWQYGGGWYGDDEMLPFLNTYFNNADGQQHVAVPHPVNYYIWGGGGAWYTTVNDPAGNSEVAVTNPSFESGTTGWRFTGTAGVVANGNTTLNPPAAPNGTNAAYITGTGGFSTTVNIPASEYVDINFNAAYIGTGDTFNVYLDSTLMGSFGPNTNNPYGRDISNNYNDYTGVAQLHTYDLSVPAGNHTITITGTGTGTSFIDQVHVGTINGIFNSGLVPLPSVSSDVVRAAAYGLQDVGYEGGFLVGDSYSDNGGTALQQQAAIDPRAQGLSAKALDQFEQSGGAFPLQFGVVGGAYNITDNIYDVTAPKLLGYKQATSMLSMAATNGTVLPKAVGHTVTLAEVTGTQTAYLSPSSHDLMTWNLLARVAGTYSITFYGYEENTLNVSHLILDGQRVPGAFTFPYQSYGNSTTLTFAISTPGLYGLALFDDGAGRIDFPAGGNATITLLSTGSPGSIPAGWTASDVGAPGVAGNSLSYDGSNWTLQGSGTGFGTASDQFQFANISHSGDGSVLAKVDGITNAAPGAQAGVVFRDGTSASAMSAAVLVTSSNGIEFEYRNGVGTAVTVGATVTGVAPEWVKLIRKGNVFSGYYSVDGVTWIQIGSSATIAMNTQSLAGIVTSSLNIADLATTNFSNVAVNGSTSPSRKLAPGAVNLQPQTSGAGILTNPSDGTSTSTGGVGVNALDSAANLPFNASSSAFSLTTVDAATNVPLATLVPAQSQPIIAAGNGPSGDVAATTSGPNVAGFAVTAGNQTISLESNDNGNNATLINAISISSTPINNTTVTALLPSTLGTSGTLTLTSQNIPVGFELDIPSASVNMDLTTARTRNASVSPPTDPTTLQGVVSVMVTAERRFTSRIATSVNKIANEGLLAANDQKDEF